MFAHSNLVGIVGENGVYTLKMILNQRILVQLINTSVQPILLFSLYQLTTCLTSVKRTFRDYFLSSFVLPEQLTFRSDSNYRTKYWSPIINHALFYNLNHTTARPSAWGRVNLASQGGLELGSLRGG